MSIVNFAVPKQLEKRVEKTIKQKGFASKAEFFRFAALYFINTIEAPRESEEERFVRLTDALKKEIPKKIKGEKILSLKQQLADL